MGPYSITTNQNSGLIKAGSKKKISVLNIEAMNFKPCELLETGFSTTQIPRLTQDETGPSAHSR